MSRVRMLFAVAVVTVATASMPATAAAQRIEGRFDKGLSVSGAVTLSVASGSGSVQVTTGADDAVRVAGTVRGRSSWDGGSDEEVRRAVRAVEARPPIVQNGGTITVGALDDEDVSKRVSISYVVTVPKRTALTVRTGSGSQEIAGLAGPVDASAGSGSLTVGAIEGPADLRTGSGSIKIDAARERVQVSTGSGRIELGRVAGRVQVNSGSGSISIREAPEAVLDISTGSGGIEVSGLVGGLNARAASGSIHIDGTPKADWQLSTSSGSIVLGIPEGSAFRVEARTNSGSIDSDHKLTVSSAGRRNLSGTVGSGGVLVSAHSSSGSIRIGH